MLVHCSAGRDRTGMISTLLLGNAGVSPEDVSADHAESVRIMVSVHANAATHDRQTAWTPAQVEACLAETAPIVREAAACTDAAFDALEVADSVRARLRTILTAA